MEIARIKIFIDNEKWFFDLLERSLSFFTYDICGDIFTVGDHSDVFSPLDALQQGMGMLLEPLLCVCTYAEFIAVIEDKIPLLMVNEEIIRRWGLEHNDIHAGDAVQLMFPLAPPPGYSGGIL